MDMDIIFYLTGSIIVLILLLVLAIYEKNVNNKNIDDFPSSIFLCFGSWISVIILIIAYNHKYADIIKIIFNR